MGRGGSWLWVLAGCVLCSAAVRAEDQPLLGLRIEGCADAAEVRAVVALELNAHVSDAELPDHATQVAARCERGAVQLEVSDPLTHKRVARAIALEHVHASARSRVIGIAIAELVSASWFELTHVASPHAPQGDERARAAALQRVRERAALWRVSLGVGPLVRLSIDNAPGLGAALQLVAQSPRALRLMFDLSGAYATRSRALGTIDTTALALGAALLLHTEGVHAGAGMRGGIARVRGDSADAVLARSGDVTGAFMGPMLVAGAGLPLGTWGELLVSGELGFALIAVRGRADGEEAASVDGPWAGLTLALHVRL